MYKNIQSSNNMIARQFATAIEAQLQQFALLSVELNKDTGIQTLMQAKEIDGALRLTVYNNIENSADFLFKYNLVYNYIIYFDSSQTILTSTGFFDAAWYFEHYVQADGMDYDEWTQFLRSQNTQMKYYSKQPDIISASDTDNYLLAIRSLSIQKPNATIIIEIPLSGLARTCFAANTNTEGIASFFLKGKHVVSSSDESLVGYDQSTGEFYAFDDRTMYSVYPVSGIQDAYIVYSLPSTSLIEKFWSTYEVIKNILVVILSIGVALTFLFAYLIEKPIDKIYTLTRKIKKQESTSSILIDVSNLENTFLQLMQKQHDAEEELHEIRHTAGQHYILDILANQEELESTQIEHLDKYEYAMPYPYVTVMLCSTPYDLTQFDENIGRLESCLPAQGHNYKIYAIPITLSTNMIIINDDKIMSNKENQELICNIQTKITRLAQDYIYVSIGEQTPIKSMSASYHTALNALEYKFLYPDIHIFTRGIIVNNSKKYFYSSEAEENIIKGIINKDSVIVEKTIDELFRINFTDMQLDINTAYLFLYALVNTAYRTGDFSGSENRQMGTQKEDPVSWIHSCNDIYEAKKNILFMYSLLYDPQTTDKSDKEQINEWRSRKIISYINESYLDPSMSLTMVADHFMVTPQYLSSIFKKNLNETFCIYVQKLRLEKSKSLMCNNNLTLNAIAEKSGFSSYLNLSRAFQKHIGMSPGVYRQIKNINTGNE
jgi:AraC-like DNA-binding protein